MQETGVVFEYGEPVEFKVVISDNDIIPMQYQNKLMVWRDVFKAGYFEIGDIANELCEYAAQHGFRITQERVFRAVGRFCDRTGRTVRYYAETAVFYPLDERQEFEELPFSHFAFAKSTNEHWREVLEYAMSHPELSADGLEREFVKRYADVGVTRDVLHMVDGVEVYNEIIRETSRDPITAPITSPITSDAQIPKPAIRASHLSAISSLIEVVSRVLFALKLRDETRRRLEGALEEIRGSLPEIMDAANKEQ